MPTQSGEVRSTEGLGPDEMHELQRSVAIHDRGSFKTGGVVLQDGSYKLHAGEQVLVAPGAAPQQDDATTQPQQADASTQDDSNLSDDSAVAGSHNLQRAYSNLNAKIRKMLDGLGVRRNATIPHQMGQNMADHLAEIGQVMSTKGNISGNILTATHSLHDKDGGSTVAHPNQPLQETIIPKDFELAKTAINACRSLISKSESLVGETPEIRRAKSQIALLSKSNGQGMTAFDLSVALLNIPTPVIQLLSRHHSFVKHGEHTIHLTGPKVRG